MKLLNKKTGIVSGICLMAASTVGLAGCKSFSGTDTSTQELDARDYQSFMEHTADVYKEYVTLGNYKDLEITAVDRSDEEATDTDVDEVIQELLSKSTTTEDVTEGGTTQDGDSIVLNYSGSIDGQAFDGGTAENQTYTVGSGKFISDLDKGLVGLEANKEYDIPVKFPDDYSSEDLKGKDAVFKVKVTKITRTVTPEANDEWVKVNASMFNNYGYGEPKNLEELKNNIKERLIQQKKEQNDIKQFDISFQAMFNKNLFFRNVEGNDEFNIIENILNKIEPFDYFNSTFKENVLQREKLSSTCFQHGIAIPHSISQQVNKSFISFTCFDKYQQWGDDQVKLVIIIGIAYHERKIFRSVFNHLVKVFTDQASIQMISKCRTYEELVKTVSNLQKE